MIDEILNTIPDFREKIQNKEINVCLLRNDDSPKAPIGGYNHIVDIEEITSPHYSDSNLGISLLGPKYVGDRFLCCIDIDGDSGQGDEEQQRKNKNSTQEWFYNIIIRAFQQKDIKPLIVRTMNGGYHIYVYIYEYPTLIHGFSNYMYPLKNMENMIYFSGIEYLFEQNPYLYNFLNKPVLDNAIEIFSNKRMMVAPGSCIDGKYYTVSPDGAQTFSEIGEIVDINIYDFIVNALKESGFIQNPDKISPIKPNTHQNVTGEERVLTKTNINKIADLIGSLYPQAGDQKHYCTLALGGYLKTQNVSIDSIQQIGQRIVENNPNLFNNNSAFITTLLHDSTQGVNGGEATGLKTLQDNLNDIIDRGVLAKKMHLWTQSPRHSFYPNGEIGNEYAEVQMNYEHNNMSKKTIVLKKQDKDFIPVIKNQVSVKHVIHDIIMLNDISDNEFEFGFDSPIYFTYTTRNQSYVSPIYENSEDMFAKYKQIEGAHVTGSKSILELVYNEFEEFDLLTKKVGSSRPGVFYNPKTNKIHRYIEDKNNIIELDIEKPDAAELNESLKLLTKINDTWPWKDNKFGILIKYGLTMPFAYISKTFYNEPHPSIMLVGEAGTLKSTAGELVVALWGNKNTSIAENIVGGGEMNSEYRFGRKMDASSYPLVVNEPEALFSRARIRELIKDAVNGQLLRKPGGNNPKAYYSRRASIYTMNATPQQADDPSYLRRFVILDFTKSERGDTPEQMEKLQFLNTDNITNNAFNELSVIGDYIIYLIAQHPDWLKLSLEDLQQKIIESLQDQTDASLDWLSEIDETNVIYVDRTDQENSVLSLILSLLRDPYYKNKNKFLNNSDPEMILRNLVNDSNYYPYITESVDGKSVIIDIGFKNLFNIQYRDFCKPITLTAIFDHLEDTTFDLESMKLSASKVKGMKKTVRGIRMTYEEFTRLITNDVGGTSDD